MTVQDFKKAFPEYAHLEGFELEDAIGYAYMHQRDRCPVPAAETILPDDHEIGKVVEEGGYTMSFTKGMLRSMDRMMEGYELPKFTNPGIVTP